MPARLISIPFLLLTAIFVYLTFWKGESFSYFMIFLMISLALIYTFSPQINWAYYKRYPPEIDKRMRELLIKNFPFYNTLSVKEKQRFRNRLALYMMTVEFLPKGWDKVPEDIKGIIAANAVLSTFHKESLLLPKFEKIVVYTIPFPSPQYPDTLHASELYESDGVLLFSAQQVMLSFLQPQQYYNLVLHEYIKAYQYTYPKEIYPVLEENDWTILEKISGLTKDMIKGIINLNDIQPNIVSGTLFFTHPEKYWKVASDLFKKWEQIFRKDINL